MERNRRDENHAMEEGGRIQVVYQKKNKDAVLRMIEPRQNENGRNKFPRALITWNLKFEGQEERKERRRRRKAKQGER